MTLARRMILLAVAALLAIPAMAHHDWRWTEGGHFELTGLITETRLGNPHGELTVDAVGEIWTAEVGQPYRNARAGLTDAMLAPGAEVTLLGERSARPEERLIKVIRVTIAGKHYDLYPERL